MTDAKKPPEPPEGGGGEEGAKKVVDEHWKAEVRREKEKLDEKLEEKLEEKLDEKLDERARQGPERKELPPADFMHFVSGIAAQTLMQLGWGSDNPAAGGKAVDLASARYSIDILGMLEEKTKGNLTPEEERYLKAALHDLRMRFVDASG